jgi:hypothetical protein
MRSSRASTRDVRKRLLRLEAEAHRLEMVSSLHRLRNPMEHLHGAPALLGLLGGAGGGLGAAAAFLGSARLGWVIRAIPLALAGWRMAQRLRTTFAARRAR